MAHNPEVEGSNPSPATKARGLFSNRERAFCMRFANGDVNVAPVQAARQVSMALVSWRLSVIWRLQVRPDTEQNVYLEAATGLVGWTYLQWTS